MSDALLGQATMEEAYNRIAELERELAEARALATKATESEVRQVEAKQKAEAREKALREALEEITHTSRDYAWKIAEEALAGKGE